MALDLSIVVTLSFLLWQIMFFLKA